MSIGHDIFGKTERKKSINSGQKGKNNERALCKVLSKWVSESNSSEILFARNLGSGARKLGTAQSLASDISCVTEGFKFPYAVETKALSKVTVRLAPNSSFLLNKSNMFSKIWGQVNIDAKRVVSTPICFIRGNGDLKNTWKVLLPIKYAQFYAYIAILPDNFAVIESSEIFCNSYEYFKNI
jgi:hypothetical protein